MREFPVIMEERECLHDEHSSDQISTTEYGKVKEQHIKESVKEDVPSGILAYDCYNYFKKKLFPPHIKTESKALMKLAWGTSLNSFLSFFIPVISVLIVGHKGKNYLAAVGLGISVCNVTGNVLVVGLTSVTETLCSQAYGAGQYKRFGVVIQRSLIITFLAVLPSCALWINLDKTLVVLGQDKEVALLASYFGIYYIPGLLNIVYPSVYGSLLAFVVNGVFCYLSVYVWNFGIQGAAFALDLSYFSFCAFLLVFIYVKKMHKKTWNGWSKECLFEWKEFILFAIPSTSMTIMEWIIYETGIITMGIIGSLEQAALVVSFYLAGSIYFVSYGVSIGTAVRVGHFLGAGNPQLARNSLKVSIMIIVVFTVSIGLLLAALKDVIGFVFTSDQSVVDLVSDVVVLAAAHQIFDGIQIICIGAIRGIGYQKYGAVINFIGYMCIGIPLFLLLIFKANLKVFGFWLGVVIAVILQILGLGILLYKADWSELSRLARERAGVYTDTLPSESDGPIVETGDYGATEEQIIEEKYNCTSQENNVSETSFLKEEGQCHAPQEHPTIPQNEKQIHPQDANEVQVFFVNQSPASHSKLEIFVKVFAVTLLFLLVIFSLIFRLSHP
ncbi:multidrug and toxin extrusion protein 2-like isoform X2 [Rhopilema esculentum]|uniref:multidrug and toxin extrusion protein 2-like isoform X2 n=1 Tax=Rhopilema esculentum TaxID=499914 RepID=UPI0031D0907A